MDQSRLLVLQSGSHVPSKPEIGILINRAGNKRRDFFDCFGVRSEDVGESSSESCASLDCRKMHFSDVVAVSRLISYDSLIKYTSLAHYRSVKPKVALLWFPVIHRETLTTFS